MSYGHLLGLGVVMSIPLVIATYLFADWRPILDQFWEWVLLAIIVIGVIVGTHWLCWRLVPLRSAE